MGDYTPTQKFYLINGEELVNVEQDINYNWRRADERIKPLIEVQKTDLASITNSSVPKSTGYKWFKTYNNSFYYYYNGEPVRDTNSAVASWVVSGISFEPGYGSSNLEESRIAYSIQNGFVNLRGRLVLNGGANELPLNTTVNFMTLPAEARPARDKYFTIYGGNTTTSFQAARLFVPSASSGDPRLEFCKYGGATSSSSVERYLSLNDVFYGLAD